MSEDKKWNLFQEFGKRFIGHARDYSINSSLWYVDGHEKFPERQLQVFADMTEEQREAVRRLVYITVDTALHNLLYLFEDGEISKIRLEKDGVVIDDIREVELGALQGYIFIWGEEFSKHPPSHDNE